MARIKIIGLDSLSKDLQKQLSKEIDRQMDKKLDTLVEKLADATPIDTGEASQGWYHTKNSIENDVEHISHLNEGTSKQAPAHFVEATLLSDPSVRPEGIIVDLKE